MCIVGFYNCISKILFKMIIIIIIIIMVVFVIIT